MAQSWFLIFLSVGTAVSGQLCLKVGLRQIGQVDAANLAQMGRAVLQMATVPTVLIGLTLYGLSAFFWLIVLSRLDLSYAYPILSISYVLIPLLAWLLLGEQIPPGRWLGIAVVCMGVVLIART